MKAFPVNKHEIYNDGMDLRDYFAAQIFPAAITNSTLHQTLMELAHEVGKREEDVIADFSYVMADAMMKARGNK